MLIPRRPATERKVIGYAQFKALQMLSRKRPDARAKPSEVNPTGVVRLHTCTDMAVDGLVRIRRLTDAVKVTITRAGREAMRDFRVARAPQRAVKSKRPAGGPRKAA